MKNTHTAQFVFASVSLFTPISRFWDPSTSFRKIQVGSLTTWKNWNWIWWFSCTDSSFQGQEFGKPYQKFNLNSIQPSLDYLWWIIVLLEHPVPSKILLSSWWFPVVLKSSEVILLLHYSVHCSTGSKIAPGHGTASTCLMIGTVFLGLRVSPLLLQTYFSSLSVLPSACF